MKPFQGCCYRISVIMLANLLIIVFFVIFPTGITPNTTGKLNTFACLLAISYQHTCSVSSTFHSMFFKWYKKMCFFHFSLQLVIAWEPSHTGNRVRNCNSPVANATRNSVGDQILRPGRQWAAHLFFFLATFCPLRKTTSLEEERYD